MNVDNLTKKGWLCLVVVVFLEIMNIFFMAFIIFVRGTQINEYYTRHKRILMENKILYLDIMRKVDYYFCEDKIVPLNYLYKTMISSLHDYYEIRTSLEGVAEFSAYAPLNFNVSGRDGARRYSAVSAEPNIFQVTRTKPILGREFTDAENQKGSERVVVIGYEVWQNQFGGDAQAIDQTLRINGENYRVIGVMPEGYVFPNNTELWTPMRENANQTLRVDAPSVYGLAHIQSGASLEEINRQLGVIMQRIEEKFPKTNNGIGGYIASIPLAQAGDGLPVIYSVHIIAILVLVLAAINVGNLLLSRAVERGKETAIRVALGAPRSRLISQMLWESVIICGVGGIIGLLVLA
ncbi:MAG: FtsX-like permease family protein, partial [Moraxellaceae bacterium]